MWEPKWQILLLCIYRGLYDIVMFILSGAALNIFNLCVFQAVNR
jgi:hypothetical protein